MLIVLSLLAWPRAWVPVGSTRELDATRPNKVTLFGTDYVCWKGKTSWSVMRDSCPHRQAPLSEGLVKDGRLMCAYHGWEFECNGKCAAVPQTTSPISARMRADARTTRERQGIVWFWPWDDQTDTEPPELPTFYSSYTRDFDYDYAGLVENLMDPSHVPFAHHGLQGTRDDAVPITVTNMETSTNGYAYDFEDRTMNQNRSGRASFDGPHIVTYATKLSNKHFNLTALCAPVDVGRSRVILLMCTPLARFIPLPLLHIFTHKVFDSDTILINGQDRNVMDDGVQYVTPAAVDQSTTALRRVLKRFGHVRGSTRRSRRALIERFESHTAQCVECRRLLRSTRRLARLSIVAAVVAAAFRRVGLTILFLFTYSTAQRLASSLVYRSFKYQ